MTDAEVMALKMMPYTCPILDRMAKDFAHIFTDHKDENEFFAFVENIKKEVTCPMRIALEQACTKIVSLESQTVHE